MSDVICVTNRLLCRGSFFSRLEKIAKAAPKAIILREKDLPPEEYAALAEKCAGICEKYGAPLIIHGHPEAAERLGVSALHLPMAQLRSMGADERRRFKTLGASCHSLNEAIEAENLGCTYITAGHVFDTDCKKGLPGRGLDFLREVCAGVKIPVFAIGGITPENLPAVKNAGAAGACMMSSLMLCPDSETGRLINGNI